MEFLSWVLNFFVSGKQPILVLQTQQAVQPPSAGMRPMASSSVLQREGLKGEESIIIALSCFPHGFNFGTWQTNLKRLNLTSIARAKTSLVCGMQSILFWLHHPPFGEITETLACGRLVLL